MPTGTFETIDGGGGQPGGSSTNIPIARARGLTGLLQAGERPASTSTVLLLVLMLGGGVGGGAGWGAAVFSGGKNIDDVEAEQVELRAEIDSVKTRLDAAEEAQERDARLIRTQLAYQRWTVSALQSNNKALGAIVVAQDLEVDVTLPSLDIDDVLSTDP